MIALLLAAALGATPGGHYGGHYVGQEVLGPGGGTITGTLTLQDDITLCIGHSLTGGCNYWLVYNSTGNQFEIWHTSVDGADADGLIMSNDDGTDDMDFPGVVTATGGFIADADSAKLCSGAAGASDFCVYMDGTDAQLDCPTCVTGIKFNASPVVGTISIGADPGTLGLLVDSNISADPAAGTEQSYCFGHDANCMLSVFTEADSAGGIQNQALTVGANTFLDYSVTAGITASVTQTQGGGTALVSTVNEVSTVANANDTVTLKDAVAGRKIIVINNGANTLQIFPAASDDLGAGVDASTTLGTGEIIEFIAHDATIWATQAGSQVTHAEMFDSQNTDAFVVNAQTNVHCYHTNGMTTDSTSLANGWTQDDGGGGTSFPIAAIADAGGGDITVTTTGSHLLAVGDIVSQTNLADVAYEGIFDVLTVPGATTYTVTAAFTADDTGTMDQCAYLLAPTGGAGSYSLKWTGSATSAVNNETFDYVVYVEATAQSKIETRRKFGTATDFGSLSGGGYVAVSDGDKIVFTIANNDSAGNLTFRNLNIRLERL